MTITLRRACPDDAPAYARVMGDPAVYPGLMQMPFANEAALRTWLVEVMAPGKNDLLLVAVDDGTGVVGSCGLHPAGPQVRRRHVVTLGISVLGEWQGRGVGSQLMAAMCDYADHWIGALRMELTVFADNAGAIALYRKHGFVIEGTFRGYALRNGSYEDVHAMARIHPRPPGIPIHAA